jgi:hypothetical protein
MDLITPITTFVAGTIFTDAAYWTTWIGSKTHEII